MRLSHTKTLRKHARAVRAQATALLEDYAHITYTARVAFALAIGLFGVGTVYAFSGVENLGGFRSALTAAVAGSVVVPEKPIVLSGVSVQGEVVPTRELALSSRASGVITEMPEVGVQVNANDLVMRVDAEAARRAVRSAETALAAARLSVRANVTTATEAMSLDAAARADASTELSTASKAGREEVASVLPLLPDLITELSGMLYGGGGFSDDGTDYIMAHAGIIEADNEAISPLIARAGDGYLSAKRAYESTYALFHTQSNPSDGETEQLIIATDEMLRVIAEALDSTEELFTFIKSHRATLRYQAPEVFASYDEFLTNYQGQTNDQMSIIGGTRALLEAAHAVIDGVAPLSSSDAGELEVERAELALEEAQARLAYHELRAPFAGTIARLDKRVLDYVSDGETVALLIARENRVRVTLAQGEAVRVKVGTRALVSLEGTDVSIPGFVDEMDAVGKKDEDGAVVFEAVISFPKQDERLKPGMQVSVGFEMGLAE